MAAALATAGLLVAIGQAASAHTGRPDGMGGGPKPTIALEHGV
jgi:hypothetical protein